MANLLSIRTLSMAISEPITTAGKGIRRLKRFGGNVQFRIRGAPDGLPIPSSELLGLVAGSDDVSWFLEAGRKGAESIASILESNGVRFGDLHSVLDFGCGCGRVMRYFQSLTGPRLCGCDYNAVLIKWCRQNLPFAQFETSRLNPPLPYADGTFDFIYALSVFTHLPEVLQLQWIKELSRVLVAGGHLFITTHGEAYLEALRPEEQERFRAGRLVTKNEGEAGTNTCGTYHPVVYVREVLASGLEVVDFVPEGAKGNPRQDVFLLRKPRSISASEVREKDVKA